MARYIVCGKANDEKFAHVERLSELLINQVEDARIEIHLVHPGDWTDFVQDMSIIYKDTPPSAPSPLIYNDAGKLVGHEWEFATELNERYDVSLDLDATQLRAAVRTNQQISERFIKQRALLQELRTRSSPGQSALILVDVQNDFCEGGTLAVPNGSQVVPVLNRLRKLCAWDCIVRTQDWHPENHLSFASNNEGATTFTEIEIEGVGKQMMWPDHCVQQSTGAAFHPELEIDENDLVVQKGTLRNIDSYSAFGDSLGHTHEKTILQEELQTRAITDVFVGGLALDYCVAYTCKDAIKAGFNTYLILDACRGIAEDSINSEMQQMQDLGVKVVDSSQIPTKTIQLQKSLRSLQRTLCTEAAQTRC